MPTKADHTKFLSLRARYQVVSSDYEDLDRARSLKYGRNYQSSWLKRSDVKKLESLRDKQRKLSAQMHDLLQRISPRLGTWRLVLVGHGTSYVGRCHHKRTAFGDARSRTQLHRTRHARVQLAGEVMKLGPPQLDERATSVLVGVKKLPARYDPLSLNSAVLAAARSAERTGKDCYENIGRGGWGSIAKRFIITNKLSDVTRTINNNGDRVLRVTPERAIYWHDMVGR